MFKSLLDRRTVVLGSEIDDQTTTRIVSQIVLLGAENPRADIKLYIDSPGGDLPAALAIHDAMQFVSCDVSTWGIGRIESVAAFVLSSGAPGKRYATPTSFVNMNCSADLSRPSTAGSNEQWLAKVTRIMEDQTGRAVEQISGDLRDGQTLTAVEARDYGLVDRVVREAESGPQSN